MKLRVVVPEGLSVSTQYRAFALIAALTRHASVVWSRDGESTHVQHLLRGGCQLDLLEAIGVASHTSEQAEQSADRQQTPEARTNVEPSGTEDEEWLLVLRPRAAIEVALALRGVLICLDGAIDADTAIDSGLCRAYAFAGGRPAAAVPGVTALPPAVDASMLAAVTDAAALPRRLLLLHSGSPHDDVLWPQLRAAAHAVGLGVHCAHWGAGPRIVADDVSGAVGPQARRACLAQASVCVAGHDIDGDNDAFIDEALALGASVVPARLVPKSDTALRSWCRRGHEGGAWSGALARPACRAVSFDDTAKNIVDGLLERPRGTLSFGDHERIKEALCIADLAHVVGLPQATEDYALAFLQDDDDSKGLSALVDTFAYSNIFSILSRHAVRASDLMQRSMMVRMERGRYGPCYLNGAESVDGLVDGAALWLSQSPTRVLHVVYGAQSLLSAQRLSRRFARLPRSRDGNHFAKRPSLVVDARRPRAEDLVTSATIGAQVAGIDIARGLSLGTQQAARPAWFSRRRNAFSEQRTIMPTRTELLTRPDADQSVADACYNLVKIDDVARRFDRDDVDVWFTPSGPFVGSMMAGRNAWARWPVPVVGVLHSIHGLTISMEMLQQIQVARSAPFDGFISPTACGKQAWLRQWRAMCEWLGTVASAAPEPVIDVIPYGTNTAFFAGRDARASRLSLGLPSRGPLFVQMGRFHRREKGCLAPLLMAMREVLQTHADAYMVLAGKPNHPEETQRYDTLIAKLGLGERVEIRADVSPEQKAQLLTAADVFVSVSDNIQETYGLALIEAMAAGTTVIAPRWNGFREIVADGDTGLLVDCHWTPIAADRLFAQQVNEGLNGYGWRDLHETTAVDIDGLVRAMRALCADTPLRRRMGAAAAARARDHHDYVKQGRRMSAALLARAAAARQHGGDWQRPPRWVDDVSRAFGHYTHSMLGSESLLVATARAQDDGQRRIAFAAMELASHNEQSAIERLIARAAIAPVPLGDVQEPDLDALRVMRCLKYGLLALAD